MKKRISVKQTLKILDKFENNNTVIDTLTEFGIGIDTNKNKAYSCYNCGKNYRTIEGAVNHIDNKPCNSIL